MFFAILRETRNRIILTSDLERQGSLFFRWRSYLPIVFVVPAWIAVSENFARAKTYQIPQAWAIACLAISVIGLLLRCIVVGYAPAGTSGRNALQQRADVLNTTGLYGMLRHPLYLGNYLIALGPVLFLRHPWLAIVYTLSFALYYERIMIAEERFLLSKFGEPFQEWATKTPAIVPRLSGWTQPPLSFSLRNVLCREYTAILQICIAFFMTDMIGHWANDHELKVGQFWLWLLVVGAAQYVVLRFLKKNSTVLQIEGR